MRGGRYLIVLAGASIVIAGCGNGMAPVVDLSAAVSHTGAQTARVSVTTTTQATGMSVSFTETGVFDFARDRGMLSMQSPMGMTAIFLPPEAYIKVSGDTGGSLPGGKSWIALDTGGLGGLEGSLAGPFGGNADPADLLASLTAVSSSVTKLGASTVRGVPVTGYRVIIDPEKAAARLPGPERAGFLEFAKTLGPGTIPVDVWLDGQNLVRRVTLSLRLPAGTGEPAGARVVESTDYYDFGVPVRISAPPAAEVESISGPTSSAGLSGSASASASVGSLGSPGATSPPPVKGTLSRAQAAAAEHVVAAFWSALGHDNPSAFARTLPPGQRSCAQSFLSGAKITVSSLRVVSAQPAGHGLATVWFTVNALANVGGQSVPVFNEGSGDAQWMVTIEKAGHWYVDLARSSGSVPGAGCS
jgi:hypothetical protein